VEKLFVISILRGEVEKLFAISILRGEVEKLFVISILRREVEKLFVISILRREVEKLFAISIDSGTYYLMYLFDQTLANVNQQYYLAASGSTTITVTLAGATFVTKLKIYPTANFPSKVIVYDYQLTVENKQFVYFVYRLSRRHQLQLLYLSSLSHRKYQRILCMVELCGVNFGTKLFFLLHLLLLY
jgi:hypothetical protein